eukprot:TRINITY_DN3956_c0_g1_i6.p1 TRINITY_DN3956_c0_g1~~TRINITY_DN3956_c0_g1_i6.p1  ORF type:complete len:105 (-),score=9.55 TRINITY_DN3956_c0_g1_i6:204-518(-)
MAGITAILWNQAEALLVVTVLTCGECLITCFADSHLASLAAQVHSVSVRCILPATAKEELLVKGTHKTRVRMEPRKDAEMSPTDQNWETVLTYMNLGTKPQKHF